MSSFTIRPCTVADAETIAALSRRTFYDTFTGTCTEEDMAWFLDEYFNVPRKAAEIADPQQTTYLATDENGTGIGFMRIGPADELLQPLSDVTAAELKTLYVDKGWHGTGVAQALMETFMNAAVAKGAKLLWLGVWEHNYRAQKFYSKYGFAASGHEHPFPIGNTPQTDQWWWLRLPD